MNVERGYFIVYKKWVAWLFLKMGGMIVLFALQNKILLRKLPSNTIATA
jgi:hypothetical protein